MTFIRYTQSQDIWKPNNVNIFGSTKKQKGLKKIDKNESTKKQKGLKKIDKNGSPKKQKGLKKIDKNG